VAPTTPDSKKRCPIKALVVSLIYAYGAMPFCQDAVLSTNLLVKYSNIK
jgi:hypothetical protein